MKRKSRKIDGAVNWHNNEIDRLNYHDQNKSGTLHPTGVSGYENIINGKNENKLTKFHQWSDINITSSINCAVYLDSILIIELNYPYSSYKISVCVVPIISSNLQLTDYFSVWTTSQFTYGDSSHLPSVNDPIWTHVMTTSKKSPNHASDGNGFNYKLSGVANLLSFRIILDANTTILPNYNSTSRL